jgi:hypothetical protein
MTRTELIIQFLKVVIGLAFGGYFVWWSLQVLDRLTPEYDSPAAMVGARSRWLTLRYPLTDPAHSIYPAKRPWLEGIECNSMN